MASSGLSTLTALQDETLRAFFQQEHEFFLTGGAALAGFYLGHRRTDDLDLFTTNDDAFERGRHVLGLVAARIGATLEVRQAAPRFSRYVMSRGAEAVVIDLVRDQMHQLHPSKPERDGVRLDPPDEILANKLTALVGRAEERDLIDVMFLERAGLRVEDALAAALAKDGGCTPATLAWVLSEVTIPDDLVLPAGVTPQELREFLADLIVRLRRAAMPLTER
jgi:predicted nucleotidyltransferase component of viral defense system